MKTLAIIPARSGSQRLPGKNLRQVAGISLVRRAVEQALRIASDRPEYGITVALVSGGEPLDEVEAIEREGRHAHHILRRDSADAHGLPTGVRGWGDGEHASGFAIEQMGGAREWDAVMLLQPTSPLRSERTVTDCLLLFHEAFGWQRSVITCCTEGVPNGAVYIAPARRFYEARSWGYATAAWKVMGWRESIDVDCEADLELANAMTRARGAA